MAAAVFAIALGIRLACFTGLIADDDMGYANYARQISEGTYQLEPHHFALRYGVIVPVGVFYRLFGLSEWTTVILPLICSSLAAVFAALLAGRLSGLVGAWVAGLLMATSPVEVRYASVLLPEPVLQAVLLAGALLFLFAERRNSIILGLAAGIFFGLAYLTKEPGAFVAVAFFAFALLRRQWRVAFSLAAGVAPVLAGELAWYWSQSGDLLFRLHAMADHNRTPMAVDANELLSYRLLKAYPRMMLIPNIHFGLHSLIPLGLAAVALLRRTFSKEVWLLLLWAILPFLYLNFGTTSFSHYWVLPVAPRYIALVYPPLFVLTAIVLSGWACNGATQRRWVSMTVVVMSIVGISCAAATRGTGYHIEHVRRLKEIAIVARRHNDQICEFSGSDGVVWKRVLQIVAPDRIGCLGSLVLQLLPDLNGLPISKQSPSSFQSVGKKT
jgi:4-amino-4-deoxy-L-arabinose transferase-like glycosyltransferase